MRGRRLDRQPDIVARDDARELELVANGAPFPWQVDGDYLGDVERVEIRYEPDSLTPRRALRLILVRRALRLIQAPLPAQGGERPVGLVGDHRVDPRAAEPPDPRCPVHGPHVQPPKAAVARAPRPGPPPAVQGPQVRVRHGVSAVPVDDEGQGHVRVEARQGEQRVRCVSGV